MDLSGVASVVKEVMQVIWEKLGDVLGGLAPVKEAIVGQFGQAGLVAAYIALGVICLLVVYRLLKITFAILKYLVVPAVVLALVGTLILPYSFVFLLPITVSFCSLVLLFKA
jgi:hypothetical protein